MGIAVTAEWPSDREENFKNLVFIQGWIESQGDGVVLYVDEDESLTVEVGFKCPLNAKLFEYACGEHYTSASEWGGVL